MPVILYRHAACCAGSSPLPRGPFGEHMDPCERCGTHVALVVDDPDFPPYWAEYHGELAPDELWHFVHDAARCLARALTAQ